VIVALGLKNVCLVGHSMGGQVAITTVLKYPQCAERLVLCAPAGFEQFSMIEKTMYYSTLDVIGLLSTDEHNLRSSINHSFHRPQQHAGNMIDELIMIMRLHKPQYYKKMLETCIKSMLEEPVHNKLHLVKQPTLVIFGKNDALIPNSLIHRMSTEQLARATVKLMLNATLKMIPDCGHFVQWEKAEVVNEQVVGFCK
jgi:pimeloyl-ACP methyl ester carboxylesterase